MTFKLSEIATLCGGTVFGDGTAPITGFFTDSRQAEAGKLFVPIQGEKVDGHTFIPQVLAKGGASFSQIPCEGFAGNCILVKNSVDALQAVANAYRESFDIPFVGVTGSVGKTTTKEMIALALSASMPVLKTAENANSQVGLPLTLLQVEASHRAAVIEMGMSLPGEMERLARCARPDVAVVTNIGVSHIEYHGSCEKILEEKLHIADGFARGNLLLVNGDDALLAGLTSAEYPILRFGLGENCDYRGTNIRETQAGTHFTCTRVGQSVEMFVPVLGLHMVRNALVSLLVAESLGADTQDVVAALATYVPLQKRQEIRTLAGFTVIDDTYNASPDSMYASLSLLVKRRGGKKIALLGDMLELGSYAQKAHSEVGACARELGVDYLLTLGKETQATSEAFGGVNRCHFTDQAKALLHLRALLTPGDVLLIKGSNGMHMDAFITGMETW